MESNLDKSKVTLKIMYKVSVKEKKIQKQIKA